MKNLSICVALLALLVLASSVVAQTRSNAAIQQQLSSLGSEKISLYFDEGSKVTTIRAVSENFPDGDAKRAGLKAMNLAAGVIYPGAGLDRSPEQYMLSFWVMSGKPRFGEDHTFNVFLVNETMQFGSARYAFRARDGMEYLNFNLTRDQLKRIASESKVRFLLGRHDFTLTPSQLKLLADLYLATEVK